MQEGIVRQISGPIIRVSGLGKAGLFDLVEVGDKRITGEIIRLEGSEAIVQVYEDNTGLKPGSPAFSMGRPLSVLLGPGLIGNIYDGIQRPLALLYEQDGTFMKAGCRGKALDTDKKWRFVPDPDLVQKLASNIKITAAPGLVLGSIKETESITCKIMIPFSSNTSSSQEYIRHLSCQGDYSIFETAAKTDLGNEIKFAQWWPVRQSRPILSRHSPVKPLLTGQRVIDIFFPLSKGGTAAIPGGFGTGKTMIQHAVAKWCDADVIIYIGCGERGNEMTDVLTEFQKLSDPRSCSQDRSLMERTLLIANTSNMPVAAREVSIYTGITIAEFYRDMGYHVAVMADSTSRWAEALRELSGRMEEMPAEEGFPAYLPARLAQFYERAGYVQTLSGEEGSVSIIGAVSPPGGDFSEPVTQHTKRFIRCFWALDRDLANARHYPAISWTDSYSEYAEEVQGWWEQISVHWFEARKACLNLLKQEQRLSEIVRLIGADALPDEQKLILLTAQIVKDGFLQQNSFDEIDMYCVPDKQIKLLQLMMEFHERANACIELGAPLTKITETKIRQEMCRLKSVVENNSLNKLDEFEENMHKIFLQLEKIYRARLSFLQTADSGKTGKTL